jgi:hypothetical protein
MSIPESPAHHIAGRFPPVPYLSASGACPVALRLPVPPTPFLHPRQPPYEVVQGQPAATLWVPEGRRRTGHRGPGRAQRRSAMGRTPVRAAGPSRSCGAMSGSRSRAALPSGRGEVTSPLRGRRARKCQESSGVSGLREVLSLHRCTSLHAMHVVALQCTAMWCNAGQSGCVQRCNEEHRLPPPVPWPDSPLRRRKYNEMRWLWRQPTMAKPPPLWPDSPPPHIPWGVRKKIGVNPAPRRIIHRTASTLHLE